MTYPEFWLFEIAREAGVPLHSVVGPPQCVREQWNRPYHGLSRAEMSSLLQHLHASGDIVLSHDNEPLTTTPSNHDLIDWLRWRCEDRASYRITVQGGERWERFAHADWNRFHSFAWQSDDTLQLGATSPDRLQQAFHYVPPQNAMIVELVSIGQQTWHPWQATYWKSLPIGYTLTFACRYADYTEADEHYCGAMSSEEAIAFRRQVADASRYFREWYQPHPETPPL